MALPPRYYQKPNSLPRFLLSLVTLFIMLGALPIGVYLVGQRTQVVPQAAVEKVERSGTVSFTLEKDEQFATTSAQMAINLIAHSDQEAANLFATRVSYSSQSLELVKVATGSADLQGENQIPINGKWIEENIDNTAGRFDLVAGVPNPGILTSPDEKYVMAKLIFNVKNGGLATFHLDPDSTIFANNTNQALEVRKNDLTFVLPEVVSTLSPSPIPKARFVAFKQNPQDLSLVSPNGGETIGFNNSSEVSWNSTGLDQVAVSLLINGEKLGQIASGSASLGKLIWKPADFILPTFLTPANTYQVELDGIAKNGQVLVDKSDGPFAIVNQDINIEASQAASLAQRGGDGNKDGKIDLTDLSILLSSFGKKDNLDFGVDLNGDGVVNEVDLFLFKTVLLK